MSQDVIFRRVNGRIIPIRKSKDKPVNTTQAKEIAKGAAVAAGGVGVAIGAGKISAIAVHHAAHYENSARKFTAAASKIVRSKRAAGTQLDLGLKASTLKKASQAAQMSSKIHAKERAIKSLGTGIGGLLIGEGLVRLYEGIVGRESNSAENILARVGGVASTLALETTYTKALSGLKIPHAFTKAVGKFLRK